MYAYKIYILLTLVNKQKCIEQAVENTYIILEFINSFNLYNNLLPVNFSLLLNA